MASFSCWLRINFSSSSMIVSDTQYCYCGYAYKNRVDEQLMWS